MVWKPTIGYSSLSLRIHRHHIDKMLSSKFTSPPSEISATPLDTRFKLSFILCLAELIRHLHLNLVWVSRISVLRSSWWFDWGILLIRKRRWMLSWDLLSSWAFPMRLISPAILRRNAIALFWLFPALCLEGFSRAGCLILTQPFFFLVRALVSLTSRFVLIILLGTVCGIPQSDGELSLGEKPLVKLVVDGTTVLADLLNL